MAETKRYRSHGDDAIHFAADENWYVGAISLGFDATRRRLVDHRQGADQARRPDGPDGPAGRDGPHGPPLPTRPLASPFP